MKEKITRRDLVKGMLYVAPAILTLKALPAFAQNGSNLPTSILSDSRTGTGTFSGPNGGSSD